MYKEKWYHSPWIIGLLFAVWILIVPVILAIILIIKRNKEMKITAKKWEEQGFADLIDVKERVKILETEYQELINKKTAIQKVLEKYAPILDLNETKGKMVSQIEELEIKKNNILSTVNDLEALADLKEAANKMTENIDGLTTKKQEIHNQIAELQQNIIVLKDEILMQSFGFYEAKYGFESSEAYQAKLDEIRKRQKELVKSKNATHHSLDWTIGDDRKKGKEFIQDTIKLILRAFNNECDNAIMKVKFNNIEVSEKRIKKVFEDLNKLTDMQRVSITRSYLELKLEELYLKYEFEQKKQEEKEEQQAIKERMREEALALKELEKAKEKVEKEEKHFEQAIEKMNKQIETAKDKDLQKLYAKLKELEDQLEETKKNKEDVLFRVQNTRAGYVYIISNIGSFGEDVYKIGMTRRLEPMDRVKELGDASVPFTFDVHALIFSDDAPTLENELHKALANNKVNKVNDRKEFFRVNLKEIESLVRKNHNKTVEFTKLAEAAEYRKSQQFTNDLLQVVS
ncbi:DUF4041 domain-containing protein [Fictibacillus sp. FJAT-27399]|uniref:DUF4041 domain-containing protein n=1 Tax=Fictibacillus sp. FJAT-27399 TaxID=1729689 RepID=UPI000B0DE027|nr:DUF4041 domain-containing protein [Fictibacillus sp. FJAT-27399]